LAHPPRLLAAMGIPPVRALRLRSSTANLLRAPIAVLRAWRTGIDEPRKKSIRSKLGRVHIRDAVSNARAKNGLDQVTDRSCFRQGAKQSYQRPRSSPSAA